MRVSTLRLWITAGFGVLVTEAALIVYLFIRTNGEISSLRDSIRDLKKDNEQRNREIRTINDRLGLARRGPSDEPEPRTNGTPTRENAGPTEWIDRVRDAVLRGDTDPSAEASLRGSGRTAVLALSERYRSEESLDVRKRFIQILGSIADPESRAFLEREVLDVPQKPMKIACLSALLDQPDPPTLTTIANVLSRESDPEVLGMVVKVIGKVNTDEATATLTRKYEDLPETEKSAYLGLLVGHKRPAIRPFLERILRDTPDAGRRVLCIRALAECGDTATIPVLEKVRAGDPDEEVKREADKAITKLRQ